MRHYDVLVLRIQWKRIKTDIFVTSSTPALIHCLVVVKSFVMVLTSEQALALVNQNNSEV